MCAAQLAAVVSLSLLSSGCLHRAKTVDHPDIRAHYEREFAARELDPIEGFWQQKNEYAEGEGVVYRTDAATNQGFTYAVRLVRESRKRRLPYPYFGDRVTARWKPEIGRASCRERV